MKNFQLQHSHQFGPLVRIKFFQYLDFPLRQCFLCQSELPPRLSMPQSNLPHHFTILLPGILSQMIQTDWCQFCRLCTTQLNFRFHYCWWHYRQSLHWCKLYYFERCFLSLRFHCHFRKSTSSIWKNYYFSYFPLQQFRLILDQGHFEFQFS